jgi:hypothetical protein
MKTKPTDTKGKPRIIVEKINNKEWYLEERDLDVIQEVTLWNENPRLLPFLPDGAAAASEDELEAALRRTRGYDNLRKSIDDIGQMESIYVWRKDEDSSYLVYEGATRVAILRELNRRYESGPKVGKFRKIKAKILPPEFGDMERVILLARIHVRGTGVRSWGRYIEAKFIHENVTEQKGQRPMMTPTEMSHHMEKSLSWVTRLRDAYEFGRRFVESVDAPDAETLAVEEFSTLEEISKAAVIGSRLRDYKNEMHDGLRAEVFDMVKNKAFTEYREARFMKEFYEDPDKWALLKSGQPGIAKKLASEVKQSETGVKAKIGGLEQHIQRVLDRGDHGLGEDDVDALQRAMLLIQQELHPGVRPFKLVLNAVIRALSEVSLADVKSLNEDEITALLEAVGYFKDLVAKHNSASGSA